MDIVVLTTITAGLFILIALAEPLAARLSLPYSVILAAFGLLIGAAALFLSACNTVEGVGEDLQESSRNVKDAMSD